MIQTVPFYIPPEITKRLKHHLYFNLAKQATRDCVRMSIFFIPPISTLVRFGIQGGIEEILSM